jgi:hypothetical protein
VPTNELVDFLRQETLELAKEYARIQERSREDPGTAGDQTEENWATILRRWLPAYYHVVTKGRILSVDGDAGPQIDVAILSPAYPKKLLDKKLFLAGGVVAAFECKTTLQGKHIKSLFENNVAIQKLSNAKLGTPEDELSSNIIYGLLAHSHEWTRTPDAAASKISKRLESLDKILVTAPREMIDFICVANLGAWEATKYVLPIPEGPGRFSAATSSAFNITTSYTASSNVSDQPASFSPIGAFLTNLIIKLARKDPAMRDIGSYFQMSNLTGIGDGTGRSWPFDILSLQAQSVTRGSSGEQVFGPY